MSRLDVAKANPKQFLATEDERVGSFLTDKVEPRTNAHLPQRWLQNLGLQAMSRSRNTTRRLGSMRKTPVVESIESLVQTLPEVPRRPDGVAPNKFQQQLHSSIHHVSQANAILRKKLEVKHQTAALTRENLMHLEEIHETNRPAIQRQRKKEFIQKEMEKGRRSVASVEDKLALLKKIDEREEKSEAGKKEVRADSVLGDLRKARFRHLALMAQKRLQSVSPDVMKMEEDKGALASQIDWYLRFCGEAEADVPEESRSGGSRSPF